MEENKDKIDELIRLCCQNDKQAQRKIFEQFKNSMAAVCRRYSSSRAEAEDNLIDGFIRAFAKISSYDGRGSFEGWLRKVMINNCLSVYQRNTITISHEPIENFADETGNEEVSARFSKEELYEALDSLGERQKTAFNMIVIDGYSYAEAAKELKTNANVVKTLVYRAKQKLKLYLTDIENRRKH